jgi:proline iminopeptidase
MPHLDTEPYDHGYLEVGDGNTIYWETLGNPTGKAAVVLHGGPGSGCGSWWREYFDPATYRVVQFDQRGCGRSTPNAGDVDVDLSTNTLDHLLDDIESLREHLGIDRWLVLGVSWGTTLGLAYAERCPQRVTEAVLALIALTQRHEVEWITRDMGRLFPERWEQFRDGVPEADRAGNLADAYRRLLADPDPAVRDRAARDWCRWEDTHVSLVRGFRPSPRYDDPVFRMTFARLVTHYWAHAAWLPDGQLVREAARLGGIPAALVHGRQDVSSPLDTAWKLAQAWPGSELTVVEDAGHSGGNATITSTVLTATDRFAHR